MRAISLGMTCLASVPIEYILTPSCKRRPSRCLISLRKRHLVSKFLRRRVLPQAEVPNHPPGIPGCHPQSSLWIQRRNEVTVVLLIYRRPLGPTDLAVPMHRGMQKAPSFSASRSRTVPTAPPRLQPKEVILPPVTEKSARLGLDPPSPPHPKFQLYRLCYSWKNRSPRVVNSISRLRPFH